MKEKQKQRLRVFEMACLRKIEGVTRWDRIRNTEIYSRLNLDHDIVERIRSRRLRYFGHLNRMKKDRYPAIAYNGYVQGKRNRYDDTRGRSPNAGQKRMESYRKRAADACCDIAKAKSQVSQVKILVNSSATQSSFKK